MERYHCLTQAYRTTTDWNRWTQSTGCSENNLRNGAAVVLSPRALTRLLLTRRLLNSRNQTPRCFDGPALRMAAGLVCPKNGSARPRAVSCPLPREMESWSKKSNGAPIKGCYGTRRTEYRKHHLFRVRWVGLGYFYRGGLVSPGFYVSRHMKTWRCKPFHSGISK